LEQYRIRIEPNQLASWLSQVVFSNEQAVYGFHAPAASAHKDGACLKQGSL
jgi:hypothetical protein